MKNKKMKNKKMKKILILNLLIFSFIFLPLFVGVVGATDDSQMRTLPDTADLVGTLKLIANWLFTILMALAAIAIIGAAFMFIGSQGDEEKMKTARTWVLYALIGVLVALLAQVLVNFIDDMVPTDNTIEEPDPDPEPET